VATSPGWALKAMTRALGDLEPAQLAIRTLSMSFLRPVDERPIVLSPSVERRESGRRR
jgi:hypothetical protein